jgi:hypothetical protein
MELTTADSTTQSTGSASSRAREMLSNTSQQLYGDIFQTTPQNASREGDRFPSARKMSLSDIAYELPTGEVYDALIRAYFIGYHTMKPLFSGKSFLHEANMFASW